ncbi:hypothetical protein BDM02DRAFT_1997045 [Thelephora ganbajun]|uniref:Uncharacterized protein n=1 Tax=Thelephora ganbajun TaxID=370292 RepID=A0ACB6ZHW0_THEGA|nr:hypothetical protein BDM02DRAFT_1997045 [Thelephora ganbajun]
MEAIGAMARLDLSSCKNLRTLKMDPEMVNFPEFDALLRTISSKNFEKLIVGPGVGKIPERWNSNDLDQALHSFAERLYKLGAAKPLTMVLEFRPLEEAKDRKLDVQRIWPLFCEVGVIVEDFDSRTH